ncbi:MAG TPA: prevent-host-death protein [Deltaproteobacteria bacterium]|nr:prevent-host-death protein [Deltaproteobacteria bacterium]
MVMTSRFQNIMIQTISKSELKTKMLAYFRQLEKEGGEIIVTDNKKPVLKIVPVKEKQSFDDVFGHLQGTMKVYAPLEESTEDEWGDLK